MGSDKTSLVGKFLVPKCVFVCKILLSKSIASDPPGFSKYAMFCGVWSDLTFCFVLKLADIHKWMSPVKFIKIIRSLFDKQIKVLYCPNWTFLLFWASQSSELWSYGAAGLRLGPWWSSVYVLEHFGPMCSKIS